MGEANVLIANANHEVKVMERKNVILEGIKKIISFDPEEFLLDTTMGLLLIKGSSLDIVSLNVSNGHVELKGKVNSFEYIDNNKKVKHENSFLARLFQ